MRLYEVPRNSKMYIELSVALIGDAPKMHECLFHHIDGMYSYCTVEDVVGVKGEKIIFHLSASTPIKKIADHYEIDVNPTEQVSEKQ